MRLPLLISILLIHINWATSRAAEFAELSPIADATLIEYVPTNSMGAQPFVNAGSTANVLAPGTQLPFRNRALIKFDLSSVPPGSQILSAELHGEMTGEPLPGNRASSLFSLHRVLRDWGEGTKTSGLGGLGLGSPATVGEATWLSRFALTGQDWSIPGGEADVDFVANVSSTHYIEDPVPYAFVFPSTEEMVADVQLWVQSPEHNFGWMLRTLSETTRGTARRFGSREDGQNAPRLIVEFEPPPRFEPIRMEGDTVELRFQGVAGRAYTVEYTSELPAQSWTVLETIEPLATGMTILISDTPQGLSRIYRIVAEGGLREDALPP